MYSPCVTGLGEVVERHGRVVVTENGRLETCARGALAQILGGNVESDGGPYTLLEED